MCPVHYDLWIADVLGWLRVFFPCIWACFLACLSVGRSAYVFACVVGRGVSRLCRSCVVWLRGCLVGRRVALWWLLTCLCLVVLARA